MNKWLSLLKVIGPSLIAATVPHGADLAPIIVDAIATAEQLPNASGAEKKQHALDLVRDGAAGVNAGAGKTVLDPQLAVSTADHAIDATVGTINLAHQAHDAVSKQAA